MLRGLSLELSPGHKCKLLIGPTHISEPSNVTLGFGVAPKIFDC